MLGRTSGRPGRLLFVLVLVAASALLLPLALEARADDVGTWAPLPCGVPAGRSVAGAIRDAVGDRLVLFGGSDGYYSWNDVWALPLADGGSWTQLSPGGTAPSPRAGSASIYDARRRRLVVFGGVGLNDVWTLSLGSMAWTPLGASGTAPSPRAYCAAVYDSLRDRMLLVDGLAGSTHLNEVWVLTFSGDPTWTQLAPAGPQPMARARAAAAYDALRDRLLLFGGASSVYPSGTNDLWALSLDTPPTWSHLGPYNAPGPRRDHTLAYDAARDRLVLFGGEGYGYLADTQVLPLALNQFTWSALASGGPSARAGHAMVLDPVRDRLVVTHGVGGVPRDDGWHLNLAPGGAWQQVAGSARVVRIDASMVYDSARDRLVVFGGVDASGAGNDVWVRALDAPLTVWTLLATQGAPPTARYDAGVIYDPPRDRLVICGGNQDDVTSLGDVWTLSLGGTPTWTELQPAGPSPGARGGHAVAYDPIRDRLLLYGGEEREYCPDCPSLNIFDDVWALTLGEAPTWSELTPQGNRPLARMHAPAAYDPVGDALVITCGVALVDPYSTSWVTDSWTLSLSETPAWSQLEPAGSPPAPRDRATGVYDRVRRRLVLFGGTNANWLNDTWALWLGSQPAWTQLVPPFTPFPRSDHAAVYDPLRDRMLVFSGRPGPGGELWDTWELAWNEPATAIGGSVLQTGSLAASSPSPNPFSTRTNLSYSLAEAGRVRALVFDVQGRRVASLLDTHRAPGVHDLAWNGRDDLGRRVAPGVYILRLEAGNARAAVRLVATN